MDAQQRVFRSFLFLYFSFNLDIILFLKDQAPAAREQFPKNRPVSLFIIHPIPALLKDVFARSVRHKNTLTRSADPQAQTGALSVLQEPA
jgi:hypothetical protein